MAGFRRSGPGPQRTEVPGRGVALGGVAPLLACGCMAATRWAGSVGLRRAMTRLRWAAVVGLVAGLAGARPLAARDGAVVASATGFSTGTLFAGVAQTGGAGPPSQVPQTVRRDLEAGRYWNASRALEDHLAPVASASISDRVVLADAHVGWRNWAGAVEALAAGRPDTDDASARYWYLLGTALHRLEDADAAAEALARFAALSPGGSSEAVAARSRLVRLRAQAGGAADSLAQAVAELRALSPAVAGWTALEAARTMARAGAAQTVSRLLALVSDPDVRSRGWNLEIDAWLSAGDTAQALEALVELQQVGDGAGATGGGRGVPDAPDAAAPNAKWPDAVALLGREWRYRRALGDAEGAVLAMKGVLARTTRGTTAKDAALALWEAEGAQGLSADELRRVATAAGNGREYGTAVRAWRAAQNAGVTLGESEQMALARALNGSRDRNGAVQLYRDLSVSSDATIAARALRAWADIRRVQGRRQDLATLEDRLVDRFPGSAHALDVVFFQADDHHDAGRLTQAMDQYRQVVSMSPSADRAGLARMRWGQLHVSNGEIEAAAEVYQGYLAEFPNGRRWEEAVFWGARAAGALGDTAWAAAATARLREESPLSYYVAVGGDPESVFAALPEGSALDDPGWLSWELEVLALLQEAGLGEAAAGHADAMVKTVWESDDMLLRLAVAFAEEGRPRDGINLGWELRRRGKPWDRTLLRVVFPFPHSDLVEARARELDLDPYLLAAIVRQESAFQADVVSAAGAVGLMQVMPATGNELARKAGPRGFRQEFLTVPELNVHLGAAYLADLLRRYDGDIPLVLSAYNAGPTRANRWRRLPQAGDPLRFTERIPFRETRDYVKNVTRNRVLYRWLYGRGPQ